MFTKAGLNTDLIFRNLFLPTWHIKIITQIKKIFTQVSHCFIYFQFRIAACSVGPCMASWVTVFHRSSVLTTSSLRSGSWGHIWPSRTWTWQQSEKQPCRSTTPGGTRARAFRWSKVRHPGSLMTRVASETPGRHTLTQVFVWFLETGKSVICKKTNRTSRNSQHMQTFMWNKKQVTRWHQGKWVPQECTANLEQKPRSISEAKLLDPPRTHTTPFWPQALWDQQGEQKSF